MGRYILKFGLIVGFINVLGFFPLIFGINYVSFDYTEIIGYTLMLIAFAFVYLGIKNYRDEALKSNMGFGKGLTAGLLMTLIGATIYVLTWLIVYYVFIPDFMDKYADACFEKMKKGGSSDFDIAEKMKDIGILKALYKNPLMIVLITYGEILPIGILASLVSSLVLRKKLKT